MFERAKDEPAVLLIVAAAVIVLGVDLVELTATVERLIQLVTLAGAGAATRSQVTPTHKVGQ